MDYQQSFSISLDITFQNQGHTENIAGIYHEGEKWKIKQQSRGFNHKKGP